MKSLIFAIGMLMTQASLGNVFITELDHTGHRQSFEVSSYAITTKGAVMRLTLVNKANEMAVTYELSHENMKYINMSPMELGQLLKENLNSDNSDLSLLVKDGGKYRGFYLSEVSF